MFPFMEINIFSLFKSLIQYCGKWPSSKHPIFIILPNYFIGFAFANMGLILKLSWSTIKWGRKTNIKYFDESTWNTSTFLCKTSIFQFKDTLWMSCTIHWSKNLSQCCSFHYKQKLNDLGGKLKGLMIKMCN